MRLSRAQQNVGVPPPLSIGQLSHFRKYNYREQSVQVCASCRWQIDPQSAEPSLQRALHALLAPGSTRSPFIKNEFNASVKSLEYQRDQLAEAELMEEITRQRWRDSEQARAELRQKFSDLWRAAGPPELLLRLDAAPEVRRRLGPEPDGVILPRNPKSTPETRVEPFERIDNWGNLPVVLGRIRYSQRDPLDDAIRTTQ